MAFGVWLHSPGCRILLVLVLFFSYLMVKGEGALVKEDSSSTLFGGPNVKAKSFVWCYCDDLVCWFLGIVDGGLSRSFFPFASR